MRDQKGSSRVDGKHRIPVGKRERLQRCGSKDTCVVHQQIKPAQKAQGLLHSGLDVLGLHQIAAHTRSAHTLRQQIPQRTLRGLL